MLPIFGKSRKETVVGDDQDISCCGPSICFWFFWGLRLFDGGIGFSPIEKTGLAPIDKQRALDDYGQAL